MAARWLLCHLVILTDSGFPMSGGLGEGGADVVPHPASNTTPTTSQPGTQLCNRMECALSGEQWSMGKQGGELTTRMANHQKNPRRLIAARRVLLPLQLLVPVTYPREPTTEWMPAHTHY